MFVEHLTALKRRIDDALAGFAPKTVPIPGPSRVGKSSLIAKLTRDYPETRIDGRRHVPLLVVEVPPSATAKLLPKSVLRALGIQVPGSMSHQPLHGLVVDRISGLPDRRRDSPIAVTALVVVVYGLDLRFEIRIPFSQFARIAPSKRFTVEDKRLITTPM